MPITSVDVPSACTGRQSKQLVLISAAVTQIALQFSLLGLLSHSLHESCSIFLLFCELYVPWFAFLITAEHHADILVEMSVITLSSYSWMMVSSKSVIWYMKWRFFFPMYVLLCLPTLNFTGCCIHQLLNSIMPFCSHSVSSIPVILNHIVPSASCHLSKLCLLSGK